MTYIAIGTITNTHGLKGAVTVKTDSDFKEARYKSGNTLYIYCKKVYIPVTVKGYYSKGSLDVVSFHQYDNINDVVGFKACLLYTTEDAREALEEDQFYVSDLIGRTVSENNIPIGSVKEVRQYPQGDLLVVARKEKKDALIPFRNEFIKEITDEEIVIVSIEGLL